MDFYFGKRGNSLRKIGQKLGDFDMNFYTEVNGLKFISKEGEMDVTQK